MGMAKRNKRRYMSVRGYRFRVARADAHGWVRALDPETGTPIALRPCHTRDELRDALVGYVDRVYGPDAELPPTPRPTRTPTP